ncbi:MAG: protein kinase [Desulfobacteraceae bacterium]|nr:protein kinase [Desulfobacteraceae bacterium]MCF8094933.1 protein kinase [Desulfobacteraceae bacterium]
MYIGKYKVLGLLGKGGMGRVYKVKLPQIDKIVALKLLRPHEHMLRLLGRARIEEMFISEARILGRIRHPNVAAILDFDRDLENRLFFSMEYHCKNLGDMIGEHYLMEAPTRLIDPARAFQYADQVLAGLDRLHHDGILHRDVKPYNMLITDRDEIKIIDFGLSLLRGEACRVPESFKIGTPYFAAPEQEKDPDGVDERADLYGVGVMVWRMLTGYLPPDTGEKTRPGEINELLGEYWDNFLLRSTHPEKTKRFSDCRDMQKSMKTAYQKWHDNLEQACRMQMPEEDRRVEVESQNGALRKKPLKIQARDAERVFGLDSQWRPLIRKKTMFIPEDSGIVRDLSHGLVWQQGGTRYPVEWKNAGAYINFLNKIEFAGICTWRLPTIDELKIQIRRSSILGDYCAPAVFETSRDRLWSADSKSFTAAWFVDTSLGYVGAADFTCLCHIRGVSDDLSCCARFQFENGD